MSNGYALDGVNNNECKPTDQNKNCIGKVLYWMSTNLNIGFVSTVCRISVVVLALLCTGFSTLISHQIKSNNIIPTDITFAWI